MTKEQEKAIEILEHIKKEFKGSTKAPNINTRNTATIKIQAIETVLSMLKQKDKEIEFQKDIRNTEKNRHKKTEKSLKGMINKQNTELAEKNAEIEKKDKLNKLLIDFIYKMSIIRPGTIMYDLKEDGFDTSKCGNCKDKSCKECIKQYFERKATNNG